MRIRLEKLTKQFGGPRRPRAVLRELDAEFAPGKVTWVRGPSGCGKSTLLAITAGLLAPTTGRICFDGREPWRDRASEIARFRRQHVGFVFQAARMLPGLSLLDNVAVPLLFDRELDARGRAREQLVHFGLAEFTTARPDDLSLGELQRASVARALIASPSIVFADEPTASLDEFSRGIVIEALRAAAERGATVVVASHDERGCDVDDTVLKLG